MITNKSQNLREILLVKLQALYDVEQELIKALPKIAEKVDEAELKAVLEEHWEETKDQAARLESAFALLDVKPKKLRGDTIRGLTTDATRTIKNTESPARDAAIIASAQAVEHYEMAGYSAATEWAKELGETELAVLLEEILNEEKMADDKLSKLAKFMINSRANVTRGEEDE